MPKLNLLGNILLGIMLTAALVGSASLPASHYGSG
jgi:hypothetical protein